MNKAFVGGAWSDSEDEDQPTNDATYHMAQEKFEVSLNSSSSNNLDLQKDNEELVKFNDDFRKTLERVLKEKRLLELENVKSKERVCELESKMKILKRCKDMVEPCKSCEALTLEVNSLNGKVLELQKESLSFSKYRKSTSDLEEIISRQKMSQDKGGLGFFKQGTTTPVSLTKPIVFVKSSHDQDPIISETDALGRKE